VVKSLCFVLLNHKRVVNSLLTGPHLLKILVIVSCDEEIFNGYFEKPFFPLLEVKLHLLLRVLKTARWNEEKGFYIHFPLPTSCLAMCIYSVAMYIYLHPFHQPLH